MKITVPGSSACRALSSFAAPASMAVCRSWPQACIAPGMADAYGSPVSSVTGSASMSPRSSTTGPGRPPRSTAVTELTAFPVLTSSGSPDRASSTLRCVFGRSRPISGSRWIACRSSAISPASFAASSRTGTGSSSAHRAPGPISRPPGRGIRSVSMTVPDIRRLGQWHPAGQADRLRWPPCGGSRAVPRAGPASPAPGTWDAIRCRCSSCARAGRTRTPVYDQLRARGPAGPDPQGGWACTSYGGCESVLRDRRFAVRHRGRRTEPGRACPSSA